MDVMDEAIKINLGSSNLEIEEEHLWETGEKTKVNNLREVIAHLENVLKSSSEECVGNNDDNNSSLIEDAKKNLFVWEMTAALKYKHILPLSERKVFAKKALEILENCPFIERTEENELQQLIDYECDPECED